MDRLSKEELGARIRELRIKNGKSQEELGKSLEKSHAAVSDIERGKTELSVSDLTQIAQYFNTSVSEILKENTSGNTGVFFSHHRADMGISSKEREKIQNARKEFYKKAREEK